jgi:hypothetical protein
VSLPERYQPKREQDGQVQEKAEDSDAPPHSALLSVADRCRAMIADRIGAFITLSR